MISEFSLLVFEKVCLLLIFEYVTKSLNVFEVLRIYFEIDRCLVCMTLIVWAASEMSTSSADSDYFHAGGAGYRSLGRHS